MWWWVVLGCRGCGADPREAITWIPIEGGAFQMGSDGLGKDAADEAPRHEVHVAGFELMQSEVTVGQYDACVAAGACKPLRADAAPMCRDLGPTRPRGCLDWHMAGQVCEWLGGRLPTEAEWEYAARSRGEDRTYPWGQAEPSCSLAVLGYAENDPCGEGGPALPCSRPAGNTAQGVCDMAGNLYEWVRDPYHNSYEGAPADGSVWKGSVEFRVLRGGGLNSDEVVSTTNRVCHPPKFQYSGSGARCVRVTAGSTEAAAP
ncbi:MAG: formylglycine-generating enzyme family protein [Myxococcota bacterium]